MIVSGCGSASAAPTRSRSLTDRAPVLGLGSRAKLHVSVRSELLHTAHAIAFMGFGIRDAGRGIRVSGFGFRVLGFGFRDSVSACLESRDGDGRDSDVEDHHRARVHNLAEKTPSDTVQGYLAHKKTPSP